MKHETGQAKALRAAKAALGLTRSELAALLGVGDETVRAWLLPRSSKAHRPMPETARRLLGYVVTDPKAKKRG